MELCHLVNICFVSLFHCRQEQKNIIESRVSSARPTYGTWKCLLRSSLLFLDYLLSLKSINNKLSEQHDREPLENGKASHVGKRLHNLI